MQRLSQRACLLAAVLAAAGVSGHGQNTNPTGCQPSFRPGSLTRTIYPTGKLLTWWTQNLTCGAGSGNGCRYCLQIEVYQLTRWGFWPASFTDGGSSVCGVAYWNPCGNNSLLANLAQNWGNLVLGTPYTGTVQLVWTINSGACGSGNILYQIKQTFQVP